jgi:hypothetical protein
MNQSIESDLLAFVYWLLVETQPGFPEIEKLHEIGGRLGFELEH